MVIEGLFHIAIKIEVGIKFCHDIISIIYIEYFQHEL